MYRRAGVMGNIRAVRLVIGVQIPGRGQRCPLPSPPVSIDTTQLFSEKVLGVVSTDTVEAWPLM